MAVGRFLDELSATTPDPSGGGVAALAVTFAAGLCMMTAGLSARHLPEAPQLADQARKLRDRAAPLAQADAEAYRAVIAALRARDAAGPGKRMAAALSQACVVPMEVAGIGAEVAAVAATIASGHLNVRGDSSPPPCSRRPRPRGGGAGAINLAEGPRTRPAPRGQPRRAAASRCRQRAIH
jgi:formiminotetrahydrofolate cyclodeaminase